MAKEEKGKVKPEAGQPMMKGPEELMKELSKLRMENQMLKANLSRASSEIEMLTLDGVHKKLEWLWKVITLEGNVDIFGDEFCETCVNEFKEIMIIPKEARQQAPQAKPQGKQTPKS